MRQKIQICEIKGFVGIFRKNEMQKKRPCQKISLSVYIGDEIYKTPLCSDDSTQILLKLAKLGLDRNISTSFPGLSQKGSGNEVGNVYDPGLF